MKKTQEIANTVKHIEQTKWRRLEPFFGCGVLSEALVTLAFQQPLLLLPLLLLQLLKGLMVA